MQCCDFSSLSHHLRCGNDYYSFWDETWGKMADLFTWKSRDALVPFRTHFGHFLQDARWDETQFIFLFSFIPCPRRCQQSLITIVWRCWWLTRVLETTTWKTCEHSDGVSVDEYPQILKLDDFCSIFLVCKFLSIISFFNNDTDCISDFLRDVIFAGELVVASLQNGCFIH